MSLNWITNFAGSIFSGLTYIHITDRIGFGFVSGAVFFLRVSQTRLGGSSRRLSTGNWVRDDELWRSLRRVPGRNRLPWLWFWLHGWSRSSGTIPNLAHPSQEAQVNNITSRLSNASTKMFIVQACFGLGATISPFISTPFAQHVGRAYLYFLVAMAIAFAGMVIILVTVQGRTEAQCVGHLPLMEDEKRSAGERAVVEMDNQSRLASGVQSDVAEASAVAEDPRLLPAAGQDTARAPEAELSSGAKVKMMLKTRATWTLMAYNFVYVSVASPW